MADIYTENGIIEIQTRQFNKMRGKLSAFLPLYPVTIVYPIPREKWLIWIDEETGDLSKKRKSPAKGSAYTAFIELYRIKMFLKDPNLRLKLVLLDMEEYRLLNGWSRDKKKGSTRYDRIPTALVEEIVIIGEVDNNYIYWFSVTRIDDKVTNRFLGCWLQKAIWRFRQMQRFGNCTTNA